jgi:hypothetical protein
MEKNREQIFNTVAQKAKKIGEFLFGSMETPLHTSNYYIKEHFKPTDGEAYQPELPFSEDYEV